MLNEKKIRLAFAKVRIEHENIGKWIIYLKERIDETSLSEALLLNKISELVNEKEELSERLAGLTKQNSTELIDKKQSFSEDSVKNNSNKEIVHQVVNEVSLDDLTEQQRKTLLLIGSLEREHSSKYIPVRTLNGELYGITNIEKMQTTVANYLKRLEELFLIERKKKGRNSYVTLSDKGLSVIANYQVEKMKSSVILH